MVRNLTEYCVKDHGLNTDPDPAFEINPEGFKSRSRIL